MIKKNLVNAKAFRSLAACCQKSFGFFKSDFKTVIPNLFRNLSASGANPVRKALAFSLIELMISLIVISTVTAAFTPVITKKLKSSGVTIGGLTAGNPFENVKLGKDECSSGLSALGVTIVNNNCTMCKLDSAKPACLACSDMSCSASQFENTPDCTCRSCAATYDSKCYKCDIKGCKVCSAGYYLEGSGSSATCKEVGSYPGCDSNQCYTDPDGTPPVVKPTLCPEGSICSGGIKTDCDTPELTHKLCSGGVAVDCPEGSICDGGIETKCTTSELTHKLCTGGAVSDCPAGSICNNGIETKCTTTELTHKLCSNGAAAECPQGSICDGGIETKCTTTELTHKLCSNGVATTCPSGYTCDNGIKSESKCNTTGYYCTDGISRACSSKHTGCVNCNVETGNCTSCDTGYYINGYGCTSCSIIPNCYTCTNSSSCSRCNSGYYLNGSTCSTCPSNASCNGTSSWSCNTYYFKSGSSCLRCSSYITGCSTCTSSSYCSTCSSGYTKSGNTCALNVTCSSSQYKYGSSCYSCPTNGSCNGGTTVTCNSGYYKSGSGSSVSCQSCPTGCSACTSMTSCSSCIAGYQLQSGVCKNACTDGGIDGCKRSTRSGYVNSDCTGNVYTCLECCDGYTRDVRNGHVYAFDNGRCTGWSAFIAYCIKA